MLKKYSLDDNPPEDYGFIYQITIPYEIKISNNKSWIGEAKYIGHTKHSVMYRFGRHIESAKRDKSKFYNKWRKYPGNVNIKMIAVVKKNKMVTLETFFVHMLDASKLNKDDVLNSNLNPGENPMNDPFVKQKHSEWAKLRIGTKASPEARAKMSLSQKGRKNSPEAMEKLRQSLIGRACSPETRKKISDGNKGKQISSGARQKISDANKGRKLTKETRDRMSKSRKGRKFSLQAKKNMSEARKGIIFSDKHIENLRISHLGYKKKPESIEKIKKLHAEGHYSFLKKCVQNIETGIIYNSATEASNQTGEWRSIISLHCNGKKKPAKWKFVEESNKNIIDDKKDK